LDDVLVAFGAAVLMTVLEALGRFAWRGPYLPELMAEKLFASIPVWAFTPLLRAFGYNSKYYAFGVMIALEVAGLTLIGTVLRGRLRRRRLAGWGSAGLIVATAAPISGVVLVGLLPLLDAGFAGQSLTGGAWLTVPTVVVVAGSYASVLTCGFSRW
jgi:hypothetical protein